MKLKYVITAMGLAFAATDASAAAKQPGAEESLRLAEEAIYNYDVDGARASVASARTAIKRMRKGAAATDMASRADSIEQRVDRMASMMQRVERIAVIDSIDVDADEFFEAYRLSRGAGTLCSALTLPEDFEAADTTVVYIPENSRYMLWGADSGLMGSEQFTDGTWDSPQPIGDHLNRGGTANFPFMMADGITLYYATDGEDSMGGYDIYFSRRADDGTFLTPQNIGMPYNSPFNDYMLAIDEVTGAGWWATDRNHVPGKVTIYMFVPSEMRVNCDIDDPHLADRASLRNWRATSEGVDTTAVMARILAAETALADTSPDFTLPLPDGRVYTHWGDFRSSKARQLMEQYVDALEEDAADRRLLEDLRARYRAGNAKATERILSLEKKTEASDVSLKALVNRVIKAELPKAE